MARRRSLWSDLQRERARRESAARARDRAQQQIIRQFAQERARAALQAARQDVAERKRQELLTHEAGVAAARAMREQLNSRLTDLRSVLKSGASAVPPLTFAMLKRSPQWPAFNPGELARPSVAPDWAAFPPKAPRPFSSVVGGKARYERAKNAAWTVFQQALTDHTHAEEVRRRKLEAARRNYQAMVDNINAEAREHNAAVDHLEENFRAGSPDAVEEFFTELLALSEYPAGFPQDYQIAYRPDPRELVVQYRLPPVEIVPTTRDFRYVKTRGEIDELPRPLKEIKELYASVTHQVALRTMWECFTAPATALDVVDAVVFNGIVSATNRATGKAEELHLISAPASRADFAELVLDQLDPAACLKHLKAIVSPHPYDVEPVEPVIEFQQAKYRFAEPVDALAGIDSRPDLLKMDWYRFENLIRQLFEAMGMEVKVTRSSRDEGIDAVAYNKTDIVHRAEILIQAKRYSKCVPTNDVRALAGSVEEKRATLGVLVTTAWVSPETKAFAARNNRLRIIEGGELKHLLAEHLNLDVRIGLTRRPGGDG